MTYYVYIIECVNGHYYTGYTTDIERRYREHQQRTAKCRYTRSFPPKCLAAFWQFKTLSDALAVERDIKKLSKKAKDRLISNWQLQCKAGVELDH